MVREEANPISCGNAKSDERMYKWIWLGISIGLDEIIYYMFDKESHILNRDLTDNEKNKIGIEMQQ